MNVALYFHDSIARAAPTKELKLMKFNLLIISLCFATVSYTLSAQERVVKVDFESGAFLNNPNIPFDQPFMVEGEVTRAVEYVQIRIYHENASRPVHTFAWNRNDRNTTETFSIRVPGVLRSNTKYDFEVITYTLMSERQKAALRDNLSERISYYIRNHYRYDGKNVGISNPNTVYRGLRELIDQALTHQVSKNNIVCDAPSRLVLEELQKQRNYRFKSIFSRVKRDQREEVATSFVDRQIELIAGLVISEVMPYINSNLVQHHRSVKVKSVSTDKEPFSLPVNFGMYAWNKSTQIENVTVRNTNFTPGLGFTIPFSGRSSLASRSKLFDSFGYSMGVLIDPVRDADGNEFVTPGVSLPVYAALGFRLFKVVRLNAGVLIIGERGTQDFNGLTILPTAGLAFELNVWAGIKR